MDNRLKECLENKESTEYILPFFWQHGESHERLLEEIEAMQKANVTQFCVESRTYEKFGESEWWDDFGFILKEAKNRDMKVWLLDDKHFPSGYANGYIEKHPELKRKLLSWSVRDYFCDGKSCTVIPGGNELYAVVAYKIDDNNEICGDGVDLTECIKDGILELNINGYFRVFFFYRTSTVSNRKRLENWIDILSYESCGAMIKAVYEPHYEHFSEYFGNTFLGFFSDEPGFQVTTGTYEAQLGNPSIDRICWNDEIPKMLGHVLGIGENEVICLLPLIVENSHIEYHHIVRREYMDILTKLYRDNFCKQLGEWSRAHGVMYIGHIIEDMNAHQRLGQSAGHFFRALEYQDMSGMDIVLQQIVPNFNDLIHEAPIYGGKADPEFFNYLLAKLPSSQAHTTKRMKGRAMCEIFGAFGWAEGIPFMKYLADHMLCNGINYFVPHAFSPKFPDPDCPPHFFAGGNNGQFKAFAKLMIYMRKVAHLISGGVHRAPVAVFYNAESEWAHADYDLPQKLCKALTRAQIDFDVLCADTLENAAVIDGKICIESECYNALLLPKSEYLSDSTKKIFERIKAEGGQIVDGSVELCRANGWFDIDIDGNMPYLRYLRISRGESDIYLFKNDDTQSAARFTVKLPTDSECVLYDAWNNVLEKPNQDGFNVELKIAEGGMAILVTNEKAEKKFDYGDGKEIDINFDVTSGESIVYRGKCELSGYKKLILGDVGEVAYVKINGVDCGICAFKPYECDIEKAVRNGQNNLEIEVIPNLGYREKDFFSTFITMPKPGLLSKIRVK